VGVKVALYARVSTEQQEARGTIGSQVAALRERLAAEDREVVAEFLDDGYSGARLDRPGLDALRDAAEAGAVSEVWCLSPDRLARNYAYQVVVLEEFARVGVTVRFADAPALDDDPSARLLTQVQGVIAEYERAKIAERNRRAKLWRSRAGEVLSWKVPYAYRRVPRSGETPAHLVIHEPEAAVVRRIFADYTDGGRSIRQITGALNTEGVPTPTGTPTWGGSTVGNILANEAYVGRLYYNRTEMVPDPKRRNGKRQRRRPQCEWIPIPIPALVDDERFAAVAASRAAHTAFSPRRARPDHWLLRRLVRCGTCQLKASCITSKTTGGEVHYYHCPKHDRVRAGTEAGRCPERAIRADALDEFVFTEVRAALLRPDVLTAGERAVAARRPVPDDELLTAELARLDRKLDTTGIERRRVVDLYQADLIDLDDLRRRTSELDHRRTSLQTQRETLTDQRTELAAGNRLRQRIGAFAARAAAGIDALDFDARQRLMRLVIEEVRVAGTTIEIQLRIPLDPGTGHQPADPEPPTPPGHNNQRPPDSDHPEPVSTYDRLRPHRHHHVGVEQRIASPAGAVVEGGGHQPFGDNPLPPSSSPAGEDRLRLVVGDGGVHGLPVRLADQPPLVLVAECP
jgi:site-specific DNA recombinase